MGSFYFIWDPHNPTVLVNLNAVPCAQRSGDYFRCASVSAGISIIGVFG
jgi:hypothetical protein